MSATRHRRVRPSGKPATVRRPEPAGPVDAHIRTCDRCAGSTTALETSLCTACRRELGWEDDEDDAT